MKKVVLLILLFFNFSLYSQEVNDKEIGGEVFKFVFADIKSLHREVFLEDKYSVLNKEMYLIYENRLQRFFYLKKMSLEKGEKLRLLSEVSLLNKVNPNLEYEKDLFDVRKFNPLKYGFMFYENYDQYFQVDGTDYIILLKAYKK